MPAKKHIKYKQIWVSVPVNRATELEISFNRQALADDPMFVWIIANPTTTIAFIANKFARRKVAVRNFLEKIGEQRPER